MADNNRRSHSSSSPMDRPHRREDTRRYEQRAIKMIVAEQLPEDYIEQADSVMQELYSSGKKISTSKIRNLLGMVSGIYDVEKIRTSAEMSEQSFADLGMMRIRTVYEAGRSNDVKCFVENAKLISYMKGIGHDRQALLRFAHYMEALVAYHLFYYGKEA